MANRGGKYSKISRRSKYGNVYASIINLELLTWMLRGGMWGVWDWDAKRQDVGWVGLGC